MKKDLVVQSEINKPEFLAEQVRYHLTAAVREMMLTRETLIAAIQASSLRNDALLTVFREEIKKLKSLPRLDVQMHALEVKMDSLLHVLSLQAVKKPKRRKDARRGVKKVQKP